MCQQKISKYFKQECQFKIDHHNSQNNLFNKVNLDLIKVYTSSAYYVFKALYLVHISIESKCLCKYCLTVTKIGKNLKII